MCSCENCEEQKYLECFVDPALLLEKNKEKAPKSVKVSFKAVTLFK